MSVTCDGETGSIVTSRTCNVAYTELRSSTFDLELGDTIIAKVKARNEIDYGEFSSLSEVGLTDIVRTEPLQPPTLVSEGPATDSNQIEVFWDALTGEDAGHDTITEYKVFWDNGSSGTNWLLLVSETEGSFTCSDNYEISWCIRNSSCKNSQSRLRLVAFINIIEC